MEQFPTNSFSGAGGEETAIPSAASGFRKEILAISLVRFCDALGNSILFVVLPLYFMNFHDASFPLPPEAMVGVLISVYAIVGSIAQPFVGWLSDKLRNRKAFIIIGLGLLAAATYGFSMARGFWDLILLRCLQGVGVGLTLPTSFALISIYTTRDTRGTAMAVFASARHLGLGIGPLVGGFMLIAAGFHACFIFATLLILVGIVLFCLLVRDAQPQAAKGELLRGHLSFKSLFSRRGLLSLGFINIVMASTLILMVSLEHQINERLDQTAAEFGIAVSALLLANIVFQIPAGKLADKIGRKPMLIIGLLLLCPTTIAIGFVGDTVQLIIARVMQGIATAAIAPSSFALAADIAPKGAEGKQMSVLSASFGIGLALGPLLAGAFAGFVAFEMPFVVGGILALAALAVTFYRIQESGKEGAVPVGRRAESVEQSCATGHDVV